MEDLDSKSKKSPLVELKNGKLIFKQKSLSVEKLSETLQEIVKFREMLSQRMKKGEPPLDEIHDEHKPVVAKFAHESDKTLAALSKSIQSELLPTADDNDVNELSPNKSILPLRAIEACIKSVAVRKNYGLDAIGTGKIPASLCVWRWEVNHEYHEWLPRNVQDKAEARLAERVQAKKDVTDLFEALTQNERDTLLNSKGKLPLKDKKKATGHATDKGEDVKSQSPPSSIQQHQDSYTGDLLVVGKSDPSSTMNEGGQGTDPVTSAKEKENVKNKVGRPKKEKKDSESHNRSRSMMANFLKPRNHQRSNSTQKGLDVLSPKRSDFEKTFKPFLLKKDAILAVENGFALPTGTQHSRLGGDPKHAIVVEGEDSQTMTGPLQIRVVDDRLDDISLANMSNEEHLRYILSSLPPPLLEPPKYLQPRRNFAYKSSSALRTVRDMMSQITEAEVSGDVQRVRTLLAKLGNCTDFTPKVFAFKEDTRPGYFGTWSRTSASIGPRRPFKRDPVAIDYGYDSGEDWEDETSGDGDDVVDEGEEDVEIEEPDSDLDSWLVDDDEVVEIGNCPADLEEAFVPPSAPPATLQPKRKSEDGGQQLGKKRKVVVPLVPFAKGPCWESDLGQCETDFFKPYRIQLFNDTPFPIDPFTFIATETPNRRTDGVFAVPALPDHLAAINADSMSIVSAPSAPCPDKVPILIHANAPIKRPATIPKTPFPDTYLPELFTKMISLQTGNLTFLVESIYQDLRKYGVKKNAIEAKLKEVAEKCKEKKVWMAKKVG